MEKYIEFQLIIDTMRSSGYDYKDGVRQKQDIIEKRKRGETFTFEEHIKAIVFSMLSNSRPWKQIDNKIQIISNIFHDFNAEYLKSVNPQNLISGIEDLKCGNRSIEKQMSYLKFNIETLEKIISKYGNLDVYYNSVSRIELVKSLSQGKYKLKQMGIALVSEYLKEIGFNIVKPDVHVRRILNRWGYVKQNIKRAINLKEAEDIYIVCDKIAEEYGMYSPMVDSILWQYCAKNYFQQCTENPDCSKCLVEKCSKKVLSVT